MFNVFRLVFQLRCLEENKNMEKIMRAIIKNSNINDAFDAVISNTMASQATVTATDMTRYFRITIVSRQ